MSQAPYKICTLASHSALQILKGGHDEGYGTIAICEERHMRPYQSFKVADEIISVGNFSELTSLDTQLQEKNAIIVPHGSLLNALSFDEICNLKTNYFGNKQVLPWESDRSKQRIWLSNAGLNLPTIFTTAEDIDKPVIVKFDGAGGGRGYFLASSKADFDKKIQGHENKRYTMQEYIVGAPLYIHYFYSPLTDELEIMSFDKRYESNVDSIGRIPAKDQLEMATEASYTITGNIPIVVRESLLSEIFDMGEQVIEASKAFDGRGLFGPFCLETVITSELEFIVFEISARIVAGTNPYINGSPYTDLRYNEPMSTGRRISREIKLAYERNQLDKVFSA
jgi:5-formaminoimidazole-4-carboxamide-1-(beta)-D-ribofuranosyl 5'-monophosphate synthetase